MNMHQKVEMEHFLRDNFNVFTWSIVEIPSISPFFINHSLNVHMMARTNKQKKRKFAPDRVEDVKQGTEKLLKVDFIQEVHYPNWLSNVVIVMKASGK